MAIIFEATYDHGVLRPTAPLLGLTEGQRVKVVVCGNDEKRTESDSDFLDAMKAQGKLAAFPEAPSTITPTTALAIQGSPLSDTIIEDRR